MRNWNRTVLYVLAIAALLAAVIAPFASSKPDGLEYVAEKLGFIDVAREGIVTPVAGYEVSGVASPVLGTALAGVAGVGLTFLVGLGLFRLVAKGK